jgi:Family of unknown function (DUF6247)
VKRSGASILRTLQEVSAGEAVQFAEEYRAALQRAAGSFDLSESERVLDRWWGIAHLRLNPPSEQERDLVRRLNAGEDVGWSSPQERLAVHGR